MNFKRLIRKEKVLWHEHFLPSLLAGAVVGLISFIFEATITNILLFASVGASAAILTNSQSHHLTKLRTTIIAYIIGIILSSIIYVFNVFFPLHISINLFILVFSVSLFLWLFDVFHPPVITASLSFVLLEQAIIDFLYLFLAIFILLILVRLVTYVFSQHLSTKNFFKEFMRGF